MPKLTPLSAALPGNFHSSIVSHPHFREIRSETPKIRLACGASGTRPHQNTQKSGSPAALLDHSRVKISKNCWRPFGDPIGSPNHDVKVFGDRAKHFCIYARKRLSSPGRDYLHPEEIIFTWKRLSSREDNVFTHNCKSYSTRETLENVLRTLWEASAVIRPYRTQFVRRHLNASELSR